jgi:hypothetical protein
MSGPIVIPPATSRFRDMSDAISPTWLNGPVGQRFRYSQAVLYDALADAAGYAVRARFPLLTSSDALAPLDADRQIDRGFSESDASFANRLVQWLDLWRIAGSAGGVMLATLGLFLPTSVKIRTVDNNSNWNTYNLGATPFPFGADAPTPPTYVKGAGNWNWDGDATKWWRAWVIIYVTPLGWTAGPNWADGGHWADPGRLWGITGPTVSQIQTIRQVVAKWKPAHTEVTNIILTFNNSLFDPAQPAGGGINPDGTWGNPSNRPTGAAFIQGVS